MTRTMIDCTSANAAWVMANLAAPEMIALYVTGSPDIKWTPALRALFPHSIQVTIDQGGAGSPVSTATVRDVEPGAWTAHAAVHSGNWSAAEPTIYCDRADLDTVVAEGWRGNVWLAWPGWNGESLPHADKVHFVAVQNGFFTSYDKSVVLDDNWQSGVIVAPSPSAISITLHGRTGNMSWPYMKGATHYVVQYLTTSQATPILIGRAAQPAAPESVHMTDAIIPGLRGGIVRIYGIVTGKPTLVGTRSLP